MALNIMDLILAAIVTLSLSGVPALLCSRTSLTGQRLAAALMALGSGLGLVGIGLMLRSNVAVSLDFVWRLPFGRFSVGLDALSAFFLAPVFLIPALGAIYGLEYWRQSEHPSNGRKLGLSYGLLAGSMGLVLISRDVVLFLIAWEIMAVSAYFAATAEDDDPAVQRAGWIYLIATHAGTLCLIVMFSLFRSASGSFALLPLTAQSPLLPAIFVLAVIGFCFKAGLMPLHVWLPEAHANAPSHVSAVMSGVMLKMGVYGVVRMTSILPAPPVWWGGTLLVAGAVSAILGIAYAIGQHDMKRMLAYSSIENIGIIVMGIGLALLGRSCQRADWVVLGLGGSLLHVWNHSLFKTLLFLNAGAIIHAVQTREMNRLGGLIKRMPQTATLFLLGAVAICALPPLNGFASEWLIYIGLLHTVSAGSASAYPAAGLAVAVLALVGALAGACFIKAFGGIFLGEGRTDAVQEAHDPSRNLIVPMTILAAGCLALGLMPWLAAPMLDDVAALWSGQGLRGLQPILALAPLGWISMMGLVLIAAGAMIAIFVMTLLGRKSVARSLTWDCGYARPTPRMQYTGSSFAQTLVGLLAWALWPKTRPPKLSGIFPRYESFSSEVPDAVLERLILPFFRFSGRTLHGLRLLQQGRIQIYIVYFLAAVMLLLLWGRFGY